MVLLSPFTLVRNTPTPTNGPTASTASAHRHPSASASIGTSWMLAMVSRKPSDVCSASAVPTACGGVCGFCYFSSIDEEIDELVKSGQNSVVLLRPVNFHSIMMSLATGQSLFRLLFFNFNYFRIMSTE